MWGALHAELNTAKEAPEDVEYRLSIYNKRKLLLNDLLGTYEEELRIIDSQAPQIQGERKPWSRKTTSTRRSTG